MTTDRISVITFPPPLENGDRLTRVEFERRYSAHPELKKAELIEGIVYIALPVRITHGESHASAIGWLGFYKALTPGLQLGDNCTVRLDNENEVQPDILLRIQSGGQSIVSEQDYVEGAPELIVEIAASSVSIDLHGKFRVYQRHRVQEYLIWRVYDRAIDWFRLREDNYVPLQPDSEGIIKSEIFPGLWLDIPALLSGDLAKVLEVLQRGIALPEHRDFVKSLLEN
ncbi:Uma2 family endonuclease [Pannus brasiliensis CCIBt3594]|uniref:Uma2 family endonuclease n=1 Tax=Pannus brasiliensis CCIBt3594 TaxID=1427578 RepID=A0AAW9QTZ9_9CHRO